LARSCIGTPDRGFEKIYRLVVDFILGVVIIVAVAHAAEGTSIQHSISILKVGVMSGEFVPGAILYVLLQVFFKLECVSRSELVHFI
jgi:hypothetical protein